MVKGTEHFRNINRHTVETHPQILSLRVDERLYFANSSYMQSALLKRIGETPELKHVILMCSAVNDVDLSALEMLEALNTRLSDMGIKMHLSEVKGPVMDRLKNSDFLEHLNGFVYLTQYQAYKENLPEQFAPK